MRVLGAVLGAALLLPNLGLAAASDDVGATATVGDAENEASGPKFPVGAMIIYDNSLGLGTFVADEYARNPAWSMSASIRPSLTLWERLKLSLRVDVVKNITTSFQGNANADASGESYMRQMSISDVNLMASYPEIYREPVTGIGLGAGLTAYAPTSMLSRASNQVFALRPHAGLNWAWEGLSLGYTFFFKKNFHTTTNPTHNVDYLPNSLQFRPGGPEDLGNGEIAIGSARNTSHLVYNSMAASYTFLDVVTLSTSLMIVNSFKYTQPLSDEYSSEYANASGQTDLTSGGVELSYQPWENLGFALGVTSLQTAFTADNKQFRFPFFDFVSPGDNLTAFYFDVIGTI